MDGSMDGEDVFPCKGCGEVRIWLPPDALLSYVML
jgi:hypothetical protein